MKILCDRLVVDELEDILEQEENFVIDHSVTEQEEYKKILQNFNKKLISKRKSQNAEFLESNIISPSKISNIWPWLTYQELQNPTVTIPEAPTLIQNTNNTTSESPILHSPPIVLQSPSKIISASCSPLKLNKAVIGFRTPKKSNLAENIWNTIECLIIFWYWTVWQWCWWEHWWCWWQGDQNMQGLV